MLGIRKSCDKSTTETPIQTQDGGGRTDALHAVFHVKVYREYGQRGESHERAVATRINGVVDDDRSAIGRDDTHRADL